MKKCLKKLGKVLAITSILAISMQSMVVHAVTANVTASATLTTGSLAVSAAASTETFTAQSSTSTACTTSTTTSNAAVSISAVRICNLLGTYTATDTRGTAQGWALTATWPHLTFKEVPSGGSTGDVMKHPTGGGSDAASDDLVVSGTFSGLTVRTASNPNTGYHFEITTGGTANSGNARATVTDPEGKSVTGVVIPSQSSSATAITMSAASESCGFCGLSFTPDDSHTFVVGDEYSLMVDRIPLYSKKSSDATNINAGANTTVIVTPGSITAASGSATNVVAGSTVGSLAAATDSATTATVSLMGAQGGYGMGSYTQTTMIDATVEPNMYFGTYSSVMTLTLV